MTYGYICVSSDKQTADNQRFEISQFAEREGIIIDGWIEETSSGSKGYDKRKLGALPGKFQFQKRSFRFMKIFDLLNHQANKPVP